MAKSNPLRESMNKKPRSTREKKEVSGSGTNRALRCIGWVNREKDGDAVTGGLYTSRETAQFFAGFSDDVQVRAYIKTSASESAQAKPKPSQSHPQPPNRRKA